MPDNISLFIDGVSFTTAIITLVYIGNYAYRLYKLPSRINELTSVIYFIVFGVTIKSQDTPEFRHIRYFLEKHFTRFGNVVMDGQCVTCEIIDILKTTQHGSHIFNTLRAEDIAARMHVVESMFSYLPSRFVAYYYEIVSMLAYTVELNTKYLEQLKDQKC